MKKSIFDIADEYMFIAAEMEAYFQQNDSDEIPEDLFDRLVINRDEMESKISNYLDLISEWQGNIDILEAKRESLRAKQQGFQRSIDKLKSLIGDALELYGEPVMKKGEHTGSYRFKSLEHSVTKVHTKPVKIENIQQVPEKYRDFTITVPRLDTDSYVRLFEALIQLNLDQHVKTDELGTPKKAEIKKAIEAGEDVPGAYVDKNEYYLKIS